MYNRKASLSVMQSVTKPLGFAVWAEESSAKREQQTARRNPRLQNEKSTSRLRCAELESETLWGLTSAPGGAARTMPPVSMRGFTSKALSGGRESERKSRVTGKTHRHARTHAHAHWSGAWKREYFGLRCRSEQDRRIWYGSKSPALAHPRVTLL